MRDNFTPKTIITLAKRAGFRCSNPNCRKLTVGSHEEKDKSTLIGIGAHITAAASGGPRYNSTLTATERSSINNAIWLCVNCATLIDKDPQKFNVTLLNKWKVEVEKETADELLKGNSNKLVEEIKVKETFEERAEKAKVLRKQKQERETFLKSTEAIEVARKNVKHIFAMLKEKKALLTDHETNFHMGEMSKRDEMFSIGFEGKYVGFKWLRPDAYNLDEAILRVGLFEITGHFGLNEKEITEKTLDYKFTRDLEDNDGWVEFKSEENFTTTEDLIDLWIEDFLKYINY